MDGYNPQQPIMGFAQLLHLYDVGHDGIADEESLTGEMEAVAINSEISVIDVRLCLAQDVGAILGSEGVEVDAFACAESSGDKVVVAGVGIELLTLGRQYTPVDGGDVLLEVGDVPLARYIIIRMCRGADAEV